MSIGHLSVVLKIDGCGGVQELVSAPDDRESNDMTSRSFMEFMSIQGHSLSTVDDLMQGTTSPRNRWEMKVTGGYKGGCRDRRRPQIKRKEHTLGKRNHNNANGPSICSRNLQTFACRAVRLQGTAGCIGPSWSNA